MIMLVSLGCLAACGNSGEPANQAPTNGQAKTAEPETVAWTINGQTFRLELALDDASRTQGLSDRKSIAEDGGMLFKFAVPRKTQFVMRRCYVPIDLIFIDDDGYIDSLHAMEVIEPVGGARWKNPSSGYPTAGFVVYAVELKGGKIAELGLKRGEKLELPDEVVQLKAQ
jgi:hypothetical protein